MLIQRSANILVQNKKIVWDITIMDEMKSQNLLLNPSSAGCSVNQNWGQWLGVQRESRGIMEWCSLVLATILPAVMGLEGSRMNMYAHISATDLRVRGWHFY